VSHLIKHFGDIFNILAEFLLKKATGLDLLVQVHFSLDVYVQGRNAIEF
jgi:hypothetical protein